MENINFNEIPNSNFLVWFDSNEGEELTPDKRQKFEAKAQELAREFGFDFYFSSDLKGMHDKLKSLEEDGFFDSVEASKYSEIFLTTREKEILKRVCLNDKEIANQLHISPVTVKTHLCNLRNKFLATSKPQLLGEGLKGRFIKLEEIITE